MVVVGETVVLRWICSWPPPHPGQPLPGPTPPPARLTPPLLFWSLLQHMLPRPPGPTTPPAYPSPAHPSPAHPAHGPSSSPLSAGPSSNPPCAGPLHQHTLPRSTPLPLLGAPLLRPIPARTLQVYVPSGSEATGKGSLLARECLAVAGGRFDSCGEWVERGSCVDGEGDPFRFDGRVRNAGMTTR